MSQPEYIVFEASQDAPKMLSLPERILQRPDIALVGTGSLSCIRALYLEALRVGKLHQFFPCIQSAQAYAAGTNAQGLEAFLNRVLETPGLGGIIVYASCTEILNQTDFDGIFKRLSNPNRIPVHVLLRGPMVKRYQMPGQVLGKILSGIPETGEKLPEEIRFFPPPAPDFQFVSSAIQTMDLLPFLLTAGGCGGALECIGLPKRDYLLCHSRFTDLQVAMGAEAAAAECVAQAFREQLPATRRGAVGLMGSAVPAFTGMDRARIAGTGGVPLVDLGCDGFTPGIPGLADALVLLARQALRGAPQMQEDLVEILGYCGDTLGSPDKLAHGMEHLEKRGLRCRFWGREGFDENRVGKLNWVVSAAGLPLAQWLEKRFGTPYLAGIPFGPEQMLSWRRQVNQATDRDDELLSRISSREKPILAGKRVLLIGDPLLTTGIGRYLVEELGCKGAVLAVYAPMQAQKDFYRRYFPEQDLRSFGTPEELRTLSEDTQLVIGDPVFDMGEKPMVHLPDPQVSGGRFVDENYRIFGKKGSSWLVENIKTIFKGERV